jgi:hypothetical protein
MTARRTSVLMWIGVWAAPVAWALQHAAGVELGLAQCAPTGSHWHIPLRTWSVLVAALAAAIALVGVIAAIRAFRATRNRDEEDLPFARIHMMAMMGVTLSPLFLAIIVLNGLGTGLGDLCRTA